MGVRLLSIVSVMMLGWLPAAGAIEVPGPEPQALIEQVSTDLLRELDENRESLREVPKQLRALVDQYLLPHFDTDYSARLVLGKHWRDATPEQRQRFIDEFYQSLMKNYGDAILEFSGDRVKFLPFKGDPNAKSATVRTEVLRDDGTPVPVNYRLRATPDGWKAWDVTIEGVSYVRNYRAELDSEIRSSNLDAVIARLETEAGMSTDE